MRHVVNVTVNLTKPKRCALGLPLSLEKERGLYPSVCSARRGRLPHTAAFQKRLIAGHISETVLVAECYAPRAETRGKQKAKARRACNTKCNGARGAVHEGATFRIRLTSDCAEHPFECNAPVPSAGDAHTVAHVTAEKFEIAAGLESWTVNDGHRHGVVRIRRGSHPREQPRARGSDRLARRVGLSPSACRGFQPAVRNTMRHILFPRCVPRSVRKGVGRGEVDYRTSRVAATMRFSWSWSPPSTCIRLSPWKKPMNTW